MRAGDVQGPLSCGEPSGSGHAIGAEADRLGHVDDEARRRGVVHDPGRDSSVPSTANVATTSWLGSRTLRPAAAANSGEATNASQHRLDGRAVGPVDLRQVVDQGRRGVVADEGHRQAVRDATRGLGVPGEVAQELARDAAPVAALVGVGEPEDPHLAGGMGAAVVRGGPVAAVLDPVAREDARGGLDVALLERPHADGVQLEQLTSEVLARVVLGRVGTVEVDQHRGMDDRVLQHLVEASQGVLADDIAVARPPRELRVTVGRDVEVVLPELRHHLQHRPRRDQPSHQQPTPVVVHHPIAAPGARDLQLPQAVGPRCRCGHQSARLSAEPSYAVDSWLSNQARAPPAARTCCASAGVTRVGEPRDQVAVVLRKQRRGGPAAGRVVGRMRGWGKAHRTRSYGGTGSGDQRAARSCHGHSRHPPHRPVSDGTAIVSQSSGKVSVLVILGLPRPSISPSSRSSRWRCR